MGFKEFKEEYREGVKKLEEERKQKEAEREANKVVKETPSETEKLAKTGNFVVRWTAIWFLLPILAIMFIVGLMVVVWVWDMIF
ncbi:hypothetical protein ACM26V_09230 [Salipaludibacillus sp. HK11]|uniref:hypothetical protein n=1 Tax=Salipaludibacillus sp. HK11 TaxID=3394320 RepID=UPI0039FD8EE5